MKILVADDSKTNLTLIKVSLEKLGHEVMAATNGRQAIDMFQMSRPDLIILDVVMDGMSGFECAKEIRAISVDDWIPIIFLSGSVDDESIAQGIDAGGDDYLTKPFSEITLAAKIKAMQRIANMRNELYEATQKLTVLSSTDILTGAYNRLMFNKVIKEKIAQSQRQHVMFALLFLDLDKFKLINDTLGHHAGDLLLIEVTKRLQSCLRLDDFLARIGGDEFAVILSAIEDPDVVKLVCEKIIKVIGEPYSLNGNNVTTSTSIGIVFYPVDGMDQEVLSKNADFAMYQAKKAGRNNYKYFNQAIVNEKHEKITDDRGFELSDTFMVLHCLVSNVRVCIELKYIKRTVPLPTLQVVPNCPDYLVGLLNLEGKNVPVADLGMCIGLKRTATYSLDNPVLFCSNGQASFGFIVDKILDLKEVTKDELHVQENVTQKSLFLASINFQSDISLLINMQYVLTSCLNSEKKYMDINENKLS